MLCDQLFSGVTRGGWAVGGLPWLALVM
jgi:hypothetical protein